MKFLLNCLMIVSLKMQFKQLYLYLTRNLKKKIQELNYCLIIIYLSYTWPRRLVNQNPTIQVSTYLNTKLHIHIYLHIYIYIYISEYINIYIYSFLGGVDHKLGRYSTFKFSRKRIRCSVYYTKATSIIEEFRRFRDNSNINN